MLKDTFPVIIGGVFGETIFLLKKKDFCVGLFRVVNKVDVVKYKVEEQWF